MPRIIECLAFEVERHRKRKGLTQDALGKAIGLSKQAIWNIEKAKTGTSFDTISKLAKALGVEETDLTSPPTAIVPGKEFPDEFVEFVREARKEQEFYRHLMEDMANDMNVQSEALRELLVKDGTITKEQIRASESLDSQLAKIPEFTFPHYPSVPWSVLEPILENLSMPEIQEATSLLATLNESQRGGVLRTIRDIVEISRRTNAAKKKQRD